MLGHKSTRITTHYSSAEIHHLIEAANSICNTQKQSLGLTFLKRGSNLINAAARFRRNLTNQILEEELDMGLPP